MTTTDRSAPPATDARGHRRPRWVRRAVTAVVVVALAVGGMLGVRHRDARTATLVADALASLDLAGDELADAVVAGEAALADSAGQVTDEDVRAALGEALAAAVLDLEVPPGSRAEQTAHATGTAARARAHAARVREATEVVLADVGSWRLARATEAYAEVVEGLSAAVGSGEELLTGTEGQVAPDNAAREGLRVALDRAIGVRDSTVDVADLAAVTAATGEVVQVGDALAEAVAAVAGAHEAWRVAEAERVAAEQAAARSSAATAPSTGSGRSSGSSGSSRAGRTGSGSTSGSSPASPGGSAGTGSSGGGSWVDEGDTDLGYSGCGGGDQHGSSWEAQC